MKGLYFAIGLVMGAAAGAFATYYIMKDEYVEIPIDISDDEPDEIKEPVEQEEAKDEKVDGEERYRELLREAGYTKETFSSDMPYPISPQDFYMDEDYMKVSLTYYSDDGTLTDDLGDPLDEMEAVGALGRNWRSLLDGCPIDEYYIRNDERECDYEILKDIKYVD